MWAPKGQIQIRLRCDECSSYNSKIVPIDQFIPSGNALPMFNGEENGDDWDTMLSEPCDFIFDVFIMFYRVSRHHRCQEFPFNTSGLAYNVCYRQNAPRFCKMYAR